MQLTVFTLGLLLGSVFPAQAFFGYLNYKGRPAQLQGHDFGAPLFLTPYLEQGRIPEAQQAARVNLTSQIQCFSGFFTVDKKYNSNLFFWYFPAEEKAESAPVLVWLQGGPGASSLFGLFEEHGPFYVTKPGGLGIRDIRWSSKYNVIYIDNPVGTGFSFTDDEAGYANNEEDVGRHLYSAMLQFFTMFPSLQKNEFFVTGESYGGKYVPALAYTIHQYNPSAALKINLQGLAIGNGLSDPINQLNYGDYLYQVGLIDASVRDYFVQQETILKAQISAGDYDKAFDTFNELILGGNYFYNVTRFTSHYSIINDDGESPYGDMNAFLAWDFVRKAIHVGTLEFHDGSKVEQHLSADIPKSVAPWVTALVNNYRVMTYNGQLDIIVAYPLTEAYLAALDWCGAGDYKKAVRSPWSVDGQLAGYVKAVAPASCNGSLTEVLVRNAGHMVPSDQPAWAFSLISSFVDNKPLALY